MLVEKGPKKKMKTKHEKIKNITWAHLGSLVITWTHLGTHVTCKAKKLNVFVAWVKAVLVHGTLPILITFVTPLSFKT